jgi:hypothetical protein
LELERGGYLVQVQDFVGKREQDLSELVDKRLKEKEERAAAKCAASPALGRSQGFGTPAPHLKPKALNTLLTPSGHYGRAVISLSSPFEDRQQLVNGDGNENDRPTKRRKTVESTQSKNGYAQNLMGASLTLTSSKPPGTASIKYEPFKTKPSIPQVPTKSIDLTLDDDDDGEVSESMQPSKRDRQKISQKLKRYRSPPPKSTFASNLTGTALSLSRPEPSRYVGNKSAIKTIPKPLQDDDESSAEEEDSIPDIDAFPAPVPKARELATKKAKPKPTVISSSSSPPPIKRRKKVKALREEGINHARSGSSPVMEMTSKKSKAAPSIVRKETSNHSSSPMTDEAPKRQKIASSLPRTANKHVERDTAEQPVSALRIKAKPRRQMMMLMERPGSRSPLRDESTPKSRTAPKINPRQVDSSNEIVLSQATVRLNTFCEKQEQRLQARLNGQRPRISLDLDDLEDLDSSPLDGGINHQAIDDLLTRKPVPVDPAAVPTLNRPKTASTFAEKPRSVEVVKPVDGEVENGSSDIVSDRETSPDVDLPHFPSDKGISGEMDEEARPVSPKSPLEANTAADSSVKVESPKPANPVCESDRTLSTMDTHDPMIEDASTEAAVAEALPVQPLIEKEKLLPKISPKYKARPHKPPKDVNTALESTIEHFRAIVKSSPASPPQINAASPRPEETVFEELETPVNEASPLEKPEPASSELNLKQTRAPPPIEQISPAEEVEQAKQAVQVEQTSPTEPRNTITSGFRSAQNLHTTSDPAPPNNTIINQPRPKLLNPATRGKSLQKTVAESNEAMAQTLKTMPPPAPAPRITSLLSRTEVGRKDRSEGEGGKGGYPLTGPWSRESFDLFGNWRPPGRGVDS